MHSFICDLCDGDNFDDVLLVREKQLRTNRNGNLYLQLELVDRTGSVSARYWNATEGDGRLFDIGDFLAVKGKVQVFQGQLQVIVSSFQKRDRSTVSLTDFVPATDKDVNSLFGELRETMGKVRDPHYQAIVQAFLMDTEFVQGLLRAPAGVRFHHAYLGGLVEHVVTMVKVVDRIADLYPELNIDLLKMGLFLHDVGKVRELRFDCDFSYSDEGQLVGHIVIGVEMLTRKAAIAAELLGEPIPEDKILQLKHLILSHHGQYEFASPKLPMTPEAIALHYLDNFDAKINNFTRTIREDLNLDAMWTPYDPSLNRRLYKGSKPKPPANGKTRPKPDSKD